ncbi:MAG: CHAT domain-containing tetratricopeptide repeat protein [Bacteroidota bacterium]
MLLVLSLTGTSQTCLQKLDSAETYKYSNQEKARFYAHDLLVDLDSSRCLVDVGIAGFYNNLGLILWEINDKSKSLQALQSGLRFELQVKDSIHQDLLGLYYNLSSFYQETGDFRTAENYLKLAGRVTDRLFADRPDQKVRFLLAEGILYRETGDFQKSRAALEEAFTAATNLDDSTQVFLMIELGTTYRHFGELEKSEEQLLAAVEMSKGKQDLLHLQAIDRLSSLKIEQGEYSDSESYLLHNLEEKNKRYGNDPVLLLETLNELGFLYYRLNDLQSAEEYLNQALRKGADIRAIRPYMLNNLGTIYMRTGEIDKAEAFFKESAEGFKNLFGTLNPDYASSLSNLAAIHMQRNELGPALNIYMKVMDMDRVVYGSDHSQYATSLNNVALLYMRLGNISLSGKLLEQCRDIRKKTLGIYHPSYIKTLNDLGIYYLLQMDTVAAMNQFNLALTSEIRHMQDIFPVLTDNQRKLYFNETRSNIERFSSLAFSDRFIRSSYAEDALNHFINTKGILFYASEKMRRLIQASDDDRIIKIYESWRTTKYKLAQSYLLTEDERVKQGISIEDLEEESEKLEKQLASSYKVFAQQETNSYHDWIEISNALDDSTAMVDIIQYRNYSVKVEDNELKQGFEDLSNYAAFIIKPNEVLKPVKWRRTDEFERNFNLYKNSLKYKLIDRTSYNLFWRPVDEQLFDINRIYLSPDGIFHKMNPAVYYKVASKSYISDEYDIIHLTSGKDLLYKEEKRLVKEAAIFGNPDFSSLEEGESLQQLPGAELEANDISNILDVRRWDADVYYNKEVTENRIKTLENPGIIHIATHGYFNEDPEAINPLYSSGLYLSKDTESGNDGILSSYEAMNLALDQTSLVVLAACETGLGTVQNGEGVFGLQRAFLVAGADNILLSLLKINDNAAREFMNLFYQELLKSEDPKVAFFDARSIFKEQNKNPYNWGAFILVSKG